MMMKGKCTDNGKRVKEAMKVAGKGKEVKPAYGKPMKEKKGGYK